MNINFEMKPKPSNVLQLLVGLASIAITVCMTSGCQKGPYEVTRVTDFAVFDGQIYFLIEREIGTDTSSALSDGLAMHAKHKIIAIARCNIENKGGHAVEVVAIRDFTSAPLLRASGFKICNTNSVLVSTGGWSFQMVVLGHNHRDESKSIGSTQNIYFTEGRRLLFGCGVENWVMDTRSATMLKDPAVLKLGKTLCDESSKPSWGFAAVSTNAWAAATQDMRAKPPEILVTETDGPGKALRVGLPSGWIQLVGIHGNHNELKILLSGIDDRHQDFTLIKDQEGKDLAKAVLVGEPRADSDYNMIVSIPSYIPSRDATWERIPVDVWYPWKDQKEHFEIDASQIVANLKPAN